MGIVRAFKRLLGLLCVAVAALLGLFALVGYFADNTSGSRTLAAVIGGLAVLLLVIGLRWLRRGDKMGRRTTPPADLPTAKQRKYAARLGITALPSMSKWDLSAAIAEAERRDPTQAEKRRRVKDRIREAKYGKDTIAKERTWSDFAERVGYMLAIYKRGHETIVDVLRVNEAFIDERGKLKLGVGAPKVIRDKYIGDWLDYDKYFELPLDSLLHYEPLHANFHDDGNDAYRAVVKKGLKLVKKLK